jgi:hypothetical protein
MEWSLCDALDDQGIHFINPRCRLPRSTLKTCQTSALQKQMHPSSRYLPAVPALLGGWCSLARPFLLETNDGAAQKIVKPFFVETFGAGPSRRLQTVVRGFVVRRDDGLGLETPS